MRRSVDLEAHGYSPEVLNTLVINYGIDVGDDRARASAWFF